MKLEKLRKRQDFLAANGGRRWSAPGFVLLVRRRSGPRPQGAAAPEGESLPDADLSQSSQPDAGPPRVGFTVTKKVGTAVVRNRLKRRLRALARETLAPRAAAGTDYVLIGRSGGLTRSWTDLVSDLERALRKLAQH